MKNRARFLACAFLSILASPVAADETVRIVADSLSVRSGPSPEYASIGVVAEGQIYVAIDDADGYSEIWYNRSRGWVHSDNVQSVSSSYDHVQSGTNVRSGPGSSYPKVGFAKTDSRWALLDTSTSGNWHMIFYEGMQCWFYAKNRATTLEFVDPDEEPSVYEDVPVRVTAPQLDVRWGPGIGYDAIGTVAADQVYVSTESHYGWRKIWYSRDEGWVSEEDVADQSAEYDVVDWDWLNVRVGPGVSYAQVTSVPAGSKWVSLGYTGSWHNIYFEGGTQWMSGVGVTTYDYVAAPGEDPSPTTSPVGFVKLPRERPWIRSPLWGEQPRSRVGGSRARQRVDCGCSSLGARAP